jgi:transcriptional regulator with XRE-family HTH domain
MNAALKARRVEMGLTQVQLAVKAGVDPGTVSRTERGKHRPNEDTLSRLLRALEMEPAVEATAP